MKSLFIILGLTFSIFCFHYKYNEIKRIPATMGFEQWNKKDKYVFSYIYKGQLLSIEIKNKPGDIAFESAAQKCFNHFIKYAQNEDQKLDLIDACANPK